MELAIINLRMGYLKMIWFKYRMFEWWSSSSSITKCSFFILTSGGITLAYNFLHSTGSKNYEDNSSESKVICSRRKKGEIIVYYFRVKCTNEKKIFLMLTLNFFENTNHI